MSMPRTKAIHFKVFGLQRSGTNLARALISQNFQADYLEERETGWKHGPLRLPEGMWNGSPVRFVLCVKNPYAWAWSCYRFFQISVGGDPTMSPQFQLDPSMSFEEFLLTPSYSFLTPIHRWNQMNRLWLTTLPADRTLLVRQEDQLSDQMRVLHEAETALSLRRRHEQLQLTDQRVDVDVCLRGRMNRDYYLDRQYMENYSPCLLERVNSTIDHQLMTRFRYRREDWTLEVRQIGAMRVFVRPCTSDAADVWQTAGDPHGLIQIKESGDPITAIVDLGAGLGAWTLFAKGLWPQARMLAYEPCPDSLRLLRMNIRDFNDISLLQATREAGSAVDTSSDPRHECPVPEHVLQRLNDVGPIGLLRIGNPQLISFLLSEERIRSLLHHASWIVSRAPPQGNEGGLLEMLSTTHRIQTWTTPAGDFLRAARRLA